MIRQATPADTPALAVTLAEAFTDDPVWTWMLPAFDRKRRLFAALLRHAVPKGHVYTVADLSAVSIWSPPHDWKLPLSAMVRQAIPMLRAAGTGPAALDPAACRAAGFAARTPPGPQVKQCRSRPHSVPATAQGAPDR